MRRAILVLVLLHCALPARAERVTIYRDRYGVPSIVADRYEDAAYGLGYASAMDNVERMAKNYKFARGRLAEVEGKDQLLQDQFIRSLEFEERAEAWAKQLRGRNRATIVAYCAGANRALAERRRLPSPQGGDREGDRGIPAWIKPFTPVDVMALAILINCSFGLEAARDQLYPGMGSNQFAIAPKRAADGHAILSMDPHLPWSGIFLWYEFGIYTKEFAFRGIAVAGLPFGNMGHTDHVAWSMTTNDPMLYALYTVKTNPENPKQYSYHGRWRDYRVKTLILNYLDNGVMKTQRQTVKLTDWGPIAPLRTYAIRFSTLDVMDPDQIMNMMRARDAFEFRKALSPHAITMFNIVFADTHGNIGYQFNARAPKRDLSYDWRQPVDGDDPRTTWGPLWDDNELPYIMNPRSGVLANCNSAPYLTPLDNEMKSDWPAYLTTDRHTTRFDLLSALLAADHHISIDQAKRYATDTEVPHARRTVAALIHFAANDPQLTDARSVLAGWNCHCDIESRGCGLFTYWLLADKGNLDLAMKATSNSGWTPEEAARAIASLMAAAERMRKDHGRLDVPWGEMHFTERGKLKLPTIGYGYVVGVEEASVAPQSGTFANGVIPCDTGSSYRMIVSLSPSGIRSWSILPFGESQEPSSPHYADQLPLFVRGRYKETHFGLSGARDSAVSRRIFDR